MIDSENTTRQIPQSRSTGGLGGAESNCGMSIVTILRGLHGSNSAEFSSIVELCDAASAFVDDDRNRAWHEDYRPMLKRLEIALNAIGWKTPNV